jgi:hypothetical protein
VTRKQTGGSIVEGIFSNASDAVKTKIKNGLMEHLNELDLPDNLKELYTRYVDEFYVQPAGIVEGENFKVLWDPREIPKIASNLIRLATAQGDDWFTNSAYTRERTMFARVILGKDDKYTAAWFWHEQLEASYMRQYGTLSDANYLLYQEDAHRDTIRTQGNSSFDLYHPSLVRALDGEFNSNFPRE